MAADPLVCPRGKNANIYQKDLYELHWGGKGLEKIDGDALARFPNLHMLWLSDNKLSKVTGLEHNVRLKELYLHNNRITTICNASCCLPQLRQLQTLSLANNLLQNLAETLKVLSGHLAFLAHLDLSGNPVAEEHNYRPSVIFALPSLRVLDNAAISDAEREAATHLFIKKKIEKKIGFMTVLKPWDKAAIPPRGTRSAGEAMLFSAVQGVERSERARLREARAAAMREDAKPYFDYSWKAADGGTSTRPFEFMAKGRVPELRVRAGAVRLTAAAVAAAGAAASMAGLDADRAEVYATFDAMHVLPQALRSRNVQASLAASGASPPDLGFDAEMFRDCAAEAYQKVPQLLKMSPDEAFSVSVQLCEVGSGRLLGVGRMPIADLVREKRDQCRTSEVSLTATHGSGATAGSPMGSVALTVNSDWNTRYVPSDFLLQRQRQQQLIKVPPNRSSTSADGRPHYRNKDLCLYYTYHPVSDGGPPPPSIDGPIIFSQASAPVEKPGGIRRVTSNI